MEQSVIAEHDCNVLGGLFQIIVNDLKNGSSIWEDFLIKATKFQTQLKATIATSTSFLDAFQKVADMATTTRGGTKEIGTALTRLCLRHRSVEAKLKSFSTAILDCLITPLQDRIEEWKKTTAQLDKEHNKELKRLRQELKKRQVCDSHLTSNNFRSKKHSSRLNKAKYDFLDSLNSRGIYGTIGNVSKSNSSNLSRSLDSEMESNERYLLFEELEKKAVRRALIEERSHFCLFVKFLRPVVEEEISMLQEISHIQEIIESLYKLTMNPFDLPSSSEIVISNLKLKKQENFAWNFQTPPSSPSSLGSRKSSMCSISSYNSSSSGSTYGQTGPNKYFSLTHIPGPNYGVGNYSVQTDAGTKKSDSNRVYQGKNEVDTNSKSYEANDLQFQLDTGDSKPNTIMISSTNPFLSSYTQVANDEQYQTSLMDNNMFSLSTQDNVYSEGSITPTNYEQNSSNLPETNSSTESTRSTKSNKPPPAPPIRRTSSISNPNAITIGTLKNAGISGNYEEIYKNISFYDEINVLTKSMNDINFTLKHTDFANQNSTTANNQQTSNNKDRNISNCINSTEQNSEYQSSNNKNGSRSSNKATCNYNSQYEFNNSKSFDEDNSHLPLPAPPPEAFLDIETSTATTSTQNSHHYNKITNVHREFLETLNSKLSQSPLAHQGNTRISKRRNSNQSYSDEKDVSSYGKQRASGRSSSTTRVSSRKNLSEHFHGDFIDKLSQSLIHKQQNAELAKAVASTALQRKQSVPDLNEMGSLKNQNRVTFSSSLNLSTPNQSFQVVDIQTNSTQQPIYASRFQLKREIQELYGTLNNSNRIPYQNGFFNKL